MSAQFYAVKNSRGDYSRAYLLRNGQPTPEGAILLSAVDGSKDAAPARTFAAALQGFIATARTALHLQTNDQTLMQLIMDGLRLLSPDDEESAVDVEELADAIEDAEYQVRPTEQQTHG